MKRFFRIFLVLLLIFSSVLSSGFIGTTALSDDFNEAAISDKIDSIYVKIRALREEGYADFPSEFISDQLYEMGIGYNSLNDEVYSIHWFNDLIDGGITNFGYVQHKFSSSNCIYDIINTYGDEIYNLIVVFEPSENTVPSIQIPKITEEPVITEEPAVTEEPTELK